MDEGAVAMKDTPQLSPLSPLPPPGVGGGRPQLRGAEYLALSNRDQNLMNHGVGIITVNREYFVVKIFSRTAWLMQKLNA